MDDEHFYEERARINAGLKSTEEGLFLVGVRLAQLEYRLDMIEIDAEQLLRDTIRKALEFKDPLTGGLSVLE